MIQKDTVRLNHALHNEKACNHLLNADYNYTDWVLTTAFYSALHFVSYRIFPFKVKNKSNGKDELINELNDYYIYIDGRRRSINKHTVMKDLVADKCGDDIANCYDWLLDVANTSRYHNYQLPKQYTQRAQSYLNKIKTYCCK